VKSETRNPKQARSTKRMRHLHVSRCSACEGNSPNGCCQEGPTLAAVAPVSLWKYSLWSTLTITGGTHGTTAIRLLSCTDWLSVSGFRISDVRFVSDFDIRFSPACRQAGIFLT
jgi:hypothetical protein